MATSALEAASHHIWQITCFIANEFRIILNPADHLLYGGAFRGGNAALEISVGLTQLARSAFGRAVLSSWIVCEARKNRIQKIEEYHAAAGA
ncbi:MAG TPA: hypothetical protein PLO33_06425, partial [Kouleothrix sp.]|nr:hypothetical protein [Kouleothrix sp.]